MGDPDHPAIRIALCGEPGAGKSTTGSIIREWAQERDIVLSRLKIAAPLYRVQAAMYQELGRELHPGQQDGRLLNFLGAHFRAVEPSFLTRSFLNRCTEAAQGGAQVILCDDARPLDLGHLRSAGFAIITIAASTEVRMQRRRDRGDLTLGDDKHSTEVGYSEVQADSLIDNSGDVQDLRRTVRQTLEELVPASWAGVVHEGRHRASAPSGERHTTRESVDDERLVIPNVYGVVYREGGVEPAVLLQTRWKPESDPVNSGLLELPGGKWRSWERAEAALRREVAEESGIEIVVRATSHPLTQNQQEIARWEQVQVVQMVKGPYPSMLVVLRASGHGEPLSRGDGSRDARWYAVRELSAFVKKSPELFTPLSLSVLQSEAGSWSGQDA
jgi:ADP-ribose pyrophosphatase YjhB (NUDIX family)